MTKISESYESGNKKTNQATTRKLKISVSCESGNKTKKKREDKPKKVTVSYESVRKINKIARVMKRHQKKSVRIVP